jgi:hypothetical protein
VERQSGTSLLGRARLSKAGPARVRAVLYRAAVVAIRYNPHVKALYDRLLAQGKTKWPLSAPPCANSSICASASSKPAHLIKSIMHFPLDRKDGIYMAAQGKTL